MNTTLPQPAEANIEELPRYKLDPQWLAQNNLSLASLASGQLCAKSRKKLEGKMEVDSILAEIRRCCSKATAYIHHQQPLMEAVFRLFLASEGEPVNLIELGETLMEKGMGVKSPRDLSARTLQRLLDRDTYYGIKRVAASKV